MHRVMIVSDTHRREGNLAQALFDEGPIDMLIHLGDFEGNQDIIEEMANCKTIMVPGNNDFDSHMPSEKEITIAGKKILLTHGHYHRPVIIKENGLTLINPGSISYPRQESRKCTYIMMEFENFEKNCEIHFTIKEL